MKRTTREWVRKAEADHRAAARLHRGSDPLHDIVCFHCQQCAEKYLKGLLEELGLAVPRTHVLEDLLTLLLPHHLTLRSSRRGLVFLSDFAIGPRYPGRKASKRQAASALRWAGQVRTAVRALLGIRERRRRK
ncbi:MAG: HEPN domain-containing protein [Planctomycetes bacterium]|nr:HEPN domain-containing protein [Planctomycetota bacterium]